MNTLVIPEITDPGKLKVIARARTYKQYCGMIEDAIAGRCTFCQLDPNRNKVIYATKHVRAWICNPPEKHTRLHYIIAPIRHVIRMREMLDPERRDIWGIGAAKDFIDTLCGDASNGIIIRDGAPDLAGTIEHWHMHVMVPDGTGRVESPLYKGADDDNASLAKAIVFEKIRQGATPESLTADERELVKGRGVPGIE